MIVSECWYNFSLVVMFVCPMYSRHFTPWKLLLWKLSQQFLCKLHGERIAFMSSFHNSFPIFWGIYFSGNNFRKYLGNTFDILLSNDLGNPLKFAQHFFFNSFDNSFGNVLINSIVNSFADFFDNFFKKSLSNGS